MTDNSTAGHGSDDDRYLLPPTFLVVGAMKAGTTSLHRYLAGHPEVFMSDPKELDFFVEEKNWCRGWDWYRSHFAEGQMTAARGESSTNYAKHPRFPDVPERIASLLPDLKLIYLLRDPVERCVSHVLHIWGTNGTSGPLERDLLDPHVLACSSYALQLEQYLRYFAAEQIQILFSEELRHRRTATMQRVFSFLDVADVVPPEVDVEHGTTASDQLVLSAVDGDLPTVRDLSRSLKQDLAGYLLPDLDRLGVILADRFGMTEQVGHVDTWMANLTAR